MKKRYDIITCPGCGYEYTAGELFIPKYFLGEPKNLIRDENNKIIHDEGFIMDNKTYFICYNCNTPFKIRAQIQFITTPDNVKNMNEEYTTKINTNKLILEEL